jgi:hypothetical protein
MIHRALCLLAALLFAAFAPAAANAQTPLFRDIDLGAHGRIVLGEPFTADSIATRRPGGSYALRPGTFGGAEAIEVLLVDDRVAAIRFTYAPVEADFETYAGNMTRTYGDAERWTEEAEGGGRIGHAVWRDQATAVELRMHVRSGQVELTAMMADRRLMGNDE